MKLQSTLRKIIYPIRGHDVLSSAFLCPVPLHSIRCIIHIISSSAFLRFFYFGMMLTLSLCQSSYQVPSNKSTTQREMNIPFRATM